MKEKLIKENNEFCSSWEIIRKKGLKNYFFHSFIGFDIMVILIYVLNIFIDKDMDYLMIAIIYIGIILITPFFAWSINEFRYKKSIKKK